MRNVHLEFREDWGIILRWILGRQIVRHGNEYNGFSIVLVLAVLLPRF